MVVSGSAIAGHVHGANISAATVRRIARADMLEASTEMRSLIHALPTGGANEKGGFTSR
jgi:hypothetical protein